MSTDYSSEQVESLQASQAAHGQLISSALEATQELAQRLIKQMDQDTRWQNKVIAAIQGNSRLWTPEVPLLDPEDRLHARYAEQFRLGLFRSLKFRDLDKRSEGISVAHPRTFEWIFSMQQSSPKFVQFLESDQELYWITGKPAAGKSTLMKLISEDYRTRLHLQVWASNKDMFISQFYFWQSGSELQMTQEGLLRTLLYEAFQRYPNLAPLVFSDRLEIFVLFGAEVVWTAEWTLEELLRAYKRAVLELTKTSKLFILIDGLDEFSGNYSEQVKLIQLLQSLLSSEVKICVSSRPWNVFGDAFKARPSLRVEDLTHPDIRFYVSSKLSSSLGYTSLQSGDPQFALELIEDVSTKASGVFLWVILVVQSLLEGLADGERVSDIQRRLNSLPTDLEALFWKILKSVDFERIAQLIQIFEASKRQGESITILRLSYADDDDPELFLNLPPAPLTDTALHSRVDIMRRRLNACGKGLLEIQKNGHKPPADAEVDYLHRTVRDFINRRDVWKKIQEATSSSFNPEMRFVLSEIACFKTIEYEDTMEDSYRVHAFWEPLFSAIAAIVQRSQASPEQQACYLDDLTKAVETIRLRGRPGRRTFYSDCPQPGFWRKTPLSSFLHLAVKLQLETFVKIKATSLHAEGQAASLSFLFEIAVTDFHADYKDFKHHKPNLRIIETFLELGGDPDQPFETETLWDFVLLNEATSSELLKLFLRYGADPSAAPRILSRFGEDDQELRDLVQLKKKEASRKGSKKDIKSIKREAGSRLSRIFRKRV